MFMWFSQFSGGGSHWLDLQKNILMKDFFNGSKWSVFLDAKRTFDSTRKKKLMKFTVNSLGSLNHNVYSVMVSPKFYFVYRCITSLFSVSPELPNAFQNYTGITDLIVRSLWCWYKIQFAQNFLASSENVQFCSFQKKKKKKSPLRSRDYVLLYNGWK